MRRHGAWSLPAWVVTAGLASGWPAVALAASTGVSVRAQAGGDASARDEAGEPAGMVARNVERRNEAIDEEATHWLEIDRLEAVSRARQSGANGGGGAYDATLWLGEGVHRFVGKAEGDWRGGGLDDSRSEAHYGRLVSDDWIALVGWRHDTGEGPNREWFSFGADGPLPGDFETEWSFNLGAGGRTAFRLAVERDVDVGMHWVMQPSVELNAYGRDDPRNGIGQGLSDVRVRLRLQRALTPWIAPYVAVQWDASFGETRRLARDEGDLTRETRFVVGLGFAF